MAGNMAEPIIVREWPVSGQFQWLDLAVTEDLVCSGCLIELADAAQQRPLIMVWPAVSALLVEIDLPLRNTAQISKALPYAMEDLLAEDVDRYHLVWHRQVASGRVVVAAVTHELLAEFCQRFESVGLILQMVLPEPLLLPWQSGECGLLVDTQQAVFRHAEWLGGGGEIDLSILLLQKLHQQNEVGDTLCVWSDTESAQVEDFCNDWPGKIHKQKSMQPLVLCRQQWQFAKPLNLLTGDYAIRTADSADLTKYWPAAAIVLVALLLQVVMQWQLVSRQQQQLQAIQASSEALFKQAFPEIKRLVNLKAQADQRLSELQQQNSQQQSGFLPLLYRSGMHLKDDRQIKIQRLQFSNDSLQFRISAADTSSIEQFERRLTDEGLQVERLTGEAKTGEVALAIKQN